MAADEQFGEVVAGHVLHHPAAGLDDASVRKNHLDADEVIANRAVAKATRPAGVGGKQRADGQPLRVRRVDGQPLPAPGQFGLQLVQRDTRFDRHCHVVRRMRHHAVEVAQIDAADFCAARTGQDLPQIVQTRWLNRHRRSHAQVLKHIENRRPRELARVQLAQNR